MQNLATERHWNKKERIKTKILNHYCWWFNGSPIIWKYFKELRNTWKYFKFDLEVKLPPIKINSIIGQNIQNKFKVTVSEIPNLNIHHHQQGNSLPFHSNPYTPNTFLSTAPALGICCKLLKHHHWTNGCFLLWNELACTKILLIPDPAKGTH